MNKYKFLEALDKKGYSQREFAEIVGESYKTLNNKINGRVKISTEDASIYIQALGITNDKDKCAIFFTNDVLNIGQ